VKDNVIENGEKEHTIYKRVVIYFCPILFILVIFYFFFYLSFSILFCFLSFFLNCLSLFCFVDFFIYIFVCCFFFCISF
jgi:hypothetical protein